MTPVLMQFLLPTGEPCAFARVEIQLSRATFNEDVDGTDGVIMPRYLQAQTGADGKVLVELMPAAEHYHVTAYDTLTDAGLHYHFVVPELTPDQLPPGAALRLQDLITDGSSVSQNYDEKALALIAQTKMSVIADRAAVEIFKTASEAAAVAADASKVVAVDSAAAAQADRILAGEEAASATISAGLALTKASEAEASATAASASEDAAKTSEDNALVSETAAATSEANAAGSATTATTKAEEAADSAAAAITAKVAAETAQGLSEAARDQAQAARDTATTKATEAADSAATASNKASQLSSQLFSFNEIYIGKFAAAPTVDGNGNALKVGAIYENTVEGKIFQWEADLTWHPYDEEATTALNNAILSASNAAASEGLATQAKDTAVTKAAEALASKDAAATSAAAALASKDAAKVSQDAAKVSEDAAKTAETNAVNATALKADKDNPRLTGNVGIGVSNPLAKLDIFNANDASIKVSQGAYSGYFGVNANGPFIDTVGGKRLGIYVDSVERMQIAPDGKVGIGVTDLTLSSAKLQVSNGGTGGISIKHNYSFGAPNYALKLVGDANTPGGYLSQFSAIGGFELAQGATYYGGGPWRTDGNSTSYASIVGQDGTLMFRTQNGLTVNTNFTPAERMRITPAGNVGIGTNDPKEKLHVMGGNISIQQTDAAAVIGSRVGFLAFTGYAGYATPCRAGIESWIPSGMPGRDFQDLRFFTVQGQQNLERMRLDHNGNLLVGVTAGGCHTFSRAGAVRGEMQMNIDNCATFTAGNQYGYNAAASVMRVLSTDLTTRSISTSGTINAGGTDYAEYMTKADDCGVIEKGAIVGIDADGKLTDKWASAVSFMVKSTDPSYVGGDTWGSEEALNIKRPKEPQFSGPEYTGVDHPGDAPTEPVLVGKASEEELAAYAAKQIAYAVACAAHLAAEAAHRRDVLAHQDLVEDASHEFYTVTYPAYEAELAAFNGKLEAARQRVDRIAYCGQVPVNVTGATPGQYVVPVQAGEGISGELVSKSAMTLEQYMNAVGVVQNILPDGRANVRVKPV